MEPSGVGLSRVAVRVPRRIEPVDDILVRSGCGPLERRMFAKVYGLRDSPTLAEGERMADLLVTAGRAALDGGTAGLVLYGHTLLMAEVDLFGDFPDRLRERLGLPGARFFGVSHINCASVLRSVELARRYLARPGADPRERVLVLGGDQGSASDRGRYIAGTTVAGDAAVGLLVHGTAAGARYRYLAGASGRDTRFHRNMRMTSSAAALFQKVCSEQAVAVLDRAARAAGLGMDQLDLVMLHFSNQMFTRAFSSQSGVPKDRICMDLLPELGHNFGADALMALEHADRSGRLRPGDRCALVAIGLGAYFQAVVVEVLDERRPAGPEPTIEGGEF
ncbi:3-oxoacyl-ACP synthase [Kitasatospora sp. NBC_01287]|uniref:3-oxoacyl-[acyl-carrier-protein] synthase III C-terminal domain-containing protein n=1 Tax=Kitasatospora sp. NBC_01287 TaxID=2903573 RepID=UPI002251D1E4|nr:3-oxoacyl-[acyl-carrier-protein] synthase III C-terminal domain-containing protein [Kitasatospora sp. NBC_01287]MCX4750462.1 3-oxoacyl-ACP synthase [Kitasatospora sp. NBC_01287]